FDAIRFRHWNSSYNLDSRDLWSYLGSDDHLVYLSWVDVVSLSLVLTGTDTGGRKGKCTRRNKGIIYDVSIVFEARRNTMKEPGDYSRRMFDQPTDPVLSQVKFALRILQSQGFKGQSIAFLLTLESILEAGSREEPVRTKLLRVLEPEKDEINRGEAHMKEIDITIGQDTGSYRIVERHTNDSVAM